MAEKIYQINKKTWYRVSFYINIILFFIIALFIYLLVKDSIVAGRSGNQDSMLYIARDIAFLSISLALVFFQFFRNLLLLMRRSL